MMAGRRLANGSPRYVISRPGPRFACGWIEWSRGTSETSHGVGDGVQELRIDYGPGYRVYFGQVGLTIVLLLCGGDKSTQAKDIEQAKRYWSDYRRRS